MRTWQLHNKLQSSQLSFAGQIAKVKRSYMYHGGDILYELENVPGIWHEQCLEQENKHVTLSSAPPEKIRLIPDAWHIRNVGRLRDGRLFFVDGQLDSASGITKDFVCTFLFDPDGVLVDHSIELIGARGSYQDRSVSDALQRHLDALGDRTCTDIWVRPFSVDSEGTIFGLIPRKTAAGEWRVEFFPGNTLSFYPPWEAGEYDT